MPILSHSRILCYDSNLRARVCARVFVRVRVRACKHMGAFGLS